ncbi:MAG: exodeoxyribonuclease VII large subunit [Bacteroidales bacterium]|nr:exodeoxyribonuclease VII large subunit [Bacteroidales bacterium]
MDALTLSELALLIKETIDISFANFYNIVAEVHQFNVNYSGHAYLQLVEKEEKGDKTVANMRAMIWANKFRMIQAYFESVTGSELQEGIKILAKVEVNFHPVYGMGLVIHDIDPTYTLGDIEKRRQEIIDQLQEDGIFEMNKSLELSIVPQRIAIISSSTAAGLGDFLDHLNGNEFGYSIEYQLFDAVMQGEKTEKSIIQALDKIFKKSDDFDAVVIIRGGGSKLDLSAFDSYEIAVNIAQFPLPVLTGIGHQRDLSIADMVSYKSLKTPTAVADFIVSKINDFELEVISKFEYVKEVVKDRIEEENYILEKSYNRLKTEIVDYIYENKTTLDYLKQELRFKTNQFLYKQEEVLKNRFLDVKLLIKSKISDEIRGIKDLQRDLKNRIGTLLINQNNKLNVIEAKIDAHDPQHILDLGFSITSKNGKLVKSAEEVVSGDEITTQLKTGTLKSRVE